MIVCRKWGMISIVSADNEPTARYAVKCARPAIHALPIRHEMTLEKRALKGRKIHVGRN